jgi:tRNA pseudouridine55 synthase
MKVLTLYKPLGQTPLQCIDQFRNDHPAYKDVGMCYAGRLDPMADGLLLVLVGDECRKRKDYERLPKSYEFDVLFGIETDTYDSLGVVKEKTCRQWDTDFVQRLQSLLPTFIGTHTQPYPPYSSARVNGKPLFWWAREGRLREIEIPSKQIEIYDLKMKNQNDEAERWPSFADIQQEAVRRTTIVGGQFRQQEIAASWKNLPSQHQGLTCRQAEREPGEGCNPQLLPLKSFHISCSSGTYVRSIAHEMGKHLGTGAIAWRITRTAVGDRVA